jgi:uncharacterized protein (TIGR00730 family)
VTIFAGVRWRPGFQARLRALAFAGLPGDEKVPTKRAGTADMQPIRRLCVYCGSADAVDERYRDAARELGTRLAAAGIELVFGGGRVGLMGIVADAALTGGGRVTGVIPERLQARELAHEGVTQLVVTPTMHERKRQMAARADAFAILPGGIGTLDETFEIVTWRHLGLHDKPIFLVDAAGYWQPLLALFDHLVGSGFAMPLVPRLIIVVPDIPALMKALAAAQDGAAPRLASG